MARQMVINYGMSDIGPWSLLDPSAQSGDMIMRMMARNSMSENLQQRIDEAVKKIAEDAYEVALEHIRDNREAIDRITEELLEKETLSGDEMRTILAQYTTIPEENLKAAREQEEAKEAVVA
jgi:cell division protease FtsH